MGFAVGVLEFGGVVGEEPFEGFALLDRRRIGPVGFDRVPEGTDTFFEGVAVLGDYGCDCGGAGQREPAPMPKT